MTNSGNNNELTALFNTLCRLADEEQSEQSQFEALARQVIQLMRVSLKSQLDQDRVGKPFTVPYKDLTDLVFSHQGDFPASDILSSFRDLIIEEVLMDKYCTAGITTEDQKQERKNHFISCYDKVINHIQLAQVQYNFINTAIKSASDLAQQASDLSKETQMVIDKANATATEAKETAANANQTAEKAEKTYNTMFANYVTILGVFTAIIVTIFGGLNVLGSVVLSKNADFSTILSLAALALLCMVSLLYFLTHMILKIINKGDGSSSYSKHHLTWTFIIITIVCVMAALLGIEMTATPK